MLTIEDGRGVDGANAYIDLAGADSYHAARGNAGWTGTDPAKEAALIKAADYLNFAFDWTGDQVDEAQAMAWPRDTVQGLPLVVANANAELALLALAGDLMPATTGPRLASESVSVGGSITRSRSFAGGGGFSTDRRFPFIDRMLKRYVTGGSGGVKAQRIERA